MFFPTWVANVLWMLTVYLAIFEHVRLRFDNPVANLQFIMIVVSLVMIILNTMYNRQSPWLSLGFVVIACASLLLMIRQLRRLPPPNVHS